MSAETWGGSDRLSGAAERFSLGSAGLHQLAESEPSAGPIRPQIFATLQLLSAWCQAGPSSCSHAGHSAVFISTSLFDHSAPVYPWTFAASSSLA